MSEQVRGNEGIVYLRIEQVMERTALSKSTIYDKMKRESPRYDPSFPKQVKLGGAAARWVSSELEAWMASRRSANGAPIANDISIATPTEKKERAEGGTKKKFSPLADLNKQRTDVVRALLVKHAKRGQNLFYGDVMEKAMLSPEIPEDCKIIDDILDDLSRESHARHHVLLSALVFKECTGKRRPKDAFFDLAKSLGYTYDDPESFVSNQLVKMYELYEDPAARSDGELTWMKIRTKTFLIRRDKNSRS